MSTKEESERETEQLRRWQRTINQATKCNHCDGKGRSYAPLYGDPALGYADNGPCLWCEGTGKDKTKLCI